MAISKEDKHDVKTHLGKALANKVAKVTQDSKAPKYAPGYPKAGGDPMYLLKDKGYAKAQSKLIKTRERKSGEGMHDYLKSMGFSKEAQNAAREPKGFRSYEKNK